MNNVLFNISNKQDFRKWLETNQEKETECWVVVKRGKPVDNKHFWYVDAVEMALCFGWIDSIWKNIDGQMLSKFTPRKRKSPWTELNKERVRRLEKLGLMTNSGRKVLPEMETKKAKLPEDIEQELIKVDALENFNNFPELYKRIRIYNLSFTKNKFPNAYQKSLNNFIKNTAKNKMYGEWNDYGRLLNY